MSMSLVSLLGALFAIYLVLPLLYPLRLTTAYTYLGKRYSLPVRSAGSALFILLRGGWLASVIYAPSGVIPLPWIDNALGSVAAYCGTDGSTIFWIIVMGLGATIYTVLGGLKAVIWTDVIQFFVFVVGIASIWFLLLSETGATILVSQLGNIPRAFAGNNRQAAWGQHVQFDGLQSRSFDGTELAFQWRQLEVATVRLAGATTSTPSFTAPDRPSDGEPTTLTFALRVTTNGDPPLQSPPAMVRITIRDDPQSVVKGSPPAYHERPHDTWFDFSLKFIFGTGVTFWVLLVGNLLSRVNDSSTDQVALQRYFSASSLRRSKRAIWLNVLCDLPLMTLLYLTEAGVPVYYGIQHNPDVPADSGQVMPLLCGTQIEYDTARVGRTVYRRVVRRDHVQRRFRDQLDQRGDHYGLVPQVVGARPRRSPLPGLGPLDDAGVRGAGHHQHAVPGTNRRALADFRGANGILDGTAVGHFPARFFYTSR